MSVTLLSPVGLNKVEARPITPRLKTLEGIRLGLLNNRKPNSDILQNRIVELLQARYGLAEVVRKFKPGSSVGAEGLDVFAREVGAVITALGD
ncbi:MAG: hypothetical protein HY423_02890 [Candidatus Lambdaproteobacteria bacterium]|nr:hypothetical protein [Candidatus Lambdaproteobacteria bacterium]